MHIVINEKNKGISGGNPFKNIFSVVRMEYIIAMVDKYLTRNILLRARLEGARRYPENGYRLPKKFHMICTIYIKQGSKRDLSFTDVLPGNSVKLQ